MDFGYINIEKLEVSATIESGKKKCEVDLLSMIDGFNLIRNCPLSLGQIPADKLDKMTEREQAEIRKREHEYMLKMIEPYFPDDWKKILRRIPYFDFLGLVMRMLSGEKDRTEAEVVEEYGKNSPQHLFWLATHPEDKSNSKDDDDKKEVVPEKK